MKNKGYSIIIPAFNEEGIIGNFLCELVQILDQTDGDYEIIVINDCSTDKTRDETIASQIPITLLDHPCNKGYGAAIKTGMAKATYGMIVITDADSTYPNTSIPELVSIAEGEDLDMVVGARVGKNVKIPLIRKPAKWVITKLANYLSGTRIPDLNSGLRVMKKSVVDKFANILPNGFSFTTTITLAMLTNNHSVKYIPIDYFKRKGKSKIRPIKDTLNFTQLIIRTVLYFNPLKIFVPLSMFLVLFAFLILILSWFLLGSVLDTTFGIIIMTAVMVLAIGMLADLVDKRIQ
jgi:glycosyltransferase involved in cell wall biosynthesis